MEIIITESQLQKIHEYFTFDDIKKRYDYHVKLDKKKHPGADSFARYEMIKAFQRWVDLIYKYTSKEVFFDGVDGINVGTVWDAAWGEDYSRPELKPSRIDYTVRVFPNIDKSNPPESKEDFEEQYEKFQEVFKKVAEGMGIDYIDPVASKRSDKAKVTFDFLQLTDAQLHRKNGLNESPEPNGSYDAVLVGGLDYRSSDEPIDQQVELLKKGLGGDKKVKGFRYNASTSEVLNFMGENPDIPVFLFSAGCTKAYDLSKSPNVDKDKLYIIEPYAVSEKTKSIVRSAISNGVPSNNVFVGGSQGRGKGIVDGASNSKSSSHFGALTTVGSMKSDTEPYTKKAGSDPEIKKGYLDFISK